ncbi:MAG: ion channel [Thermodesulfobacteriota bacterium]|nr:ion channel [Thermodesulfobacteriota bacterium]
MFSLLHIIRRLAGQLRRENLHRVILVLLALILVGSAAFWFFEKELGFFDAFWWSIVTVTTVGYGDISPATLGGRVVGMLLMMLGIGFLGVFTATIAGIFIENKMMENKGMKATTEEGLFVICGWNYRGPDIVAELRADLKSKDLPIAVIAEIEEKPLDDPALHFIHGEVNEETLNKANLNKAQAVILLSEERLEGKVRDAKTILDTLTIKSLFPKVYVCVELMDSKNLEHCRLAKADEIIVVGELSTNLLVQAVLDPGVTQIVTELVSNRYGHELYKVDSPPSLIGRTFFEAMSGLKKKYDILCLGVEKKTDNKLIANPDADYILGPEDQLVVIALERPELS